MILKGLITEDIVNYKKTCMTLIFPYCTMKCDKDCGQPVCQNSALATAPKINVEIDELVRWYINNPITHAVCCQGMEPLDSWSELKEFVTELRKHSDDDIVIYTGYTKEELWKVLPELRSIPNIIVKFGRYIPGQQPHYDSVLGVNLASDNQYAEVIA